MMMDKIAHPPLKRLNLQAITIKNNVSTIIFIIETKAFCQFFRNYYLKIPLNELDVCSN